MKILKGILKRPFRHTLWYMAKRLCGVKEGQHIGKSRILPHIAILLNNDRWFWKLWLIKNRCGPEARRAFDHMSKSEFYDYSRLVWKVEHLAIPDELIRALTQSEIDTMAKDRR